MRSRPRPHSALAVAAIALALLARAQAPPAAAATDSTARGTETAVLAGGCFWGMDEVFEAVKGVTDVTSGYSGGDAAHATYDEVSTGTTGHAESVRITFDPKRVSYATLLAVYFGVAHDPTTRDRQGPDEGSQYRSAIFYASPEQKKIADATIASLTARHAFAAPIVTQVVPFRAFYPAESYHQHFAERNPTYPYIVEVDEPKMVALREKFPKLVRAR